MFPRKEKESTFVSLISICSFEWKSESSKKKDDVNSLIVLCFGLFGSLILITKGEIEESK
jgi:hypothetical protein